MTDSSRSSASRSPRFHGRIGDGTQSCAVPGCPEPGEFRAPVAPVLGRDGPAGWRWLCLDHVRAFNAGYNYFAGMSTDEIYAAQSATSGWDSEPRAFRAATGADMPPRWSDFKDPMDALGARFRQRMDEARREAADPRFTPDEHAALRTLGLEPGIDRSALRQRYATLLRDLHPDHNGGDRRHEARLQSVVEAYTLLKRSRVFAV